MKLCINVKNIRFVIYHGYHGSKSADFADILLPSAFLFERRAFVYKFICEFEIFA